LKGALLAGLCSLRAYSVEAMSHCPYLLHKFVINYLCASFIRVTDCSIRVSRSFTRGLPPSPQGCYTETEMHSKDTTVLIYLLWFNVVHYSSLFQYFVLIYYGPYSSWKLRIFFVYLFANFIIWKHYYYD